MVLCVAADAAAGAWAAAVFAAGRGELFTIPTVAEGAALQASAGSGAGPPPPAGLRMERLAQLKRQVGATEAVGSMALPRAVRECLAAPVDDSPGAHAMHACMPACQRAK